MFNNMQNNGILTDHGPEPFVVNIEAAGRMNRNYRTALWTGKYLQTTLMSIPVGGNIGVEVHPETDQFIRIVDGIGLAKMGPTKDMLNYERRVNDNYAIFIPAGTWHDVVNIGGSPLKLYSIYAPPKHPAGTVHRTKEEAEGNH